MTGSWRESATSHTGTETRPRLLREAAVGNNPGKPELIPHVAPAWKPSVKAGLSLKLVLSDGLAAYQLVGGVTAYQGDDG